MSGPSQVQDLAQPEMDVSFLSVTPGIFSTGTSGSVSLCHRGRCCVQDRRASFLPKLAAEASSKATQALGLPWGLWPVIAPLPQQRAWILAEAGLGCSCLPVQQRPSCNLCLT